MTEVVVRTAAEHSVSTSCVAAAGVRGCQRFFDLQAPSAPSVVKAGQRGAGVNIAGKLANQPDQLPTFVHLCAPSSAEVARGRPVVAAFDGFASQCVAVFGLEAGTSADVSGAQQSRTILRAVQKSGSTP